MNRFKLTFVSPESATPATDEVAWENTRVIVPTITAPAQTVRAGITVELITRRFGGGTSVRRLRNHRCAWPRRD